MLTPPQLARALGLVLALQLMAVQPACAQPQFPWFNQRAPFRSWVSLLDPQGELVTTPAAPEPAVEPPRPGAGSSPSPSPPTPANSVPATADQELPLPSPLPADQARPCSILDVLQLRSNTSFFIQALRAAGMYRLLNDPSMVATIFVPAEPAWNALLVTLGWTKDQLFSDASLPALRSVMQYHIVPRLNLTFADLALLPYLDRLPSLYDDQPIKVFNKFGSVRVAATSRQIGTIGDSDIVSCSRSAIAHMIDVVLPPDPNWRDETVVQAPPSTAASDASGPSVQLLMPEDQQAHTPQADDAIVKAFGGSG